jgi:hypothetical protein
LVDGLLLSMYRTEITTAGPIVCVRGDERLRITIQWAVQNSATSPFGDIRIFNHASEKKPTRVARGMCACSTGEPCDRALLACLRQQGWPSKECKNQNYSAPHIPDTVVKYSTERGALQGKSVPRARWHGLKPSASLTPGSEKCLVILGALFVSRPKRSLLAQIRMAAQPASWKLEVTKTSFTKQACVCKRERK